MTETHTLVIGASIAGLASAASLKKNGIEYMIIEKQSEVASPWRNHYERLHLHTSKGLSNLPFKKFDKSVPGYPSRIQVVEYLENYQKSFNINPVFNTEAISINKENNYWITKTNNGCYQSKYIIIATGAFGKAKPVYFKGIETFTGKILHSNKYKTGSNFKGQNVLVVGFGNSGSEIAMDLYEHKANVYISVRSPVNIIPRDILGIPVLRLSLLMSHLPVKIADKINAPLMRWLMGDINKNGLRKLPYGPLEQIQKEGTVPVLDTGTLKHIRKGDIKICGDINYILKQNIYFTDNKHEKFDAIIACIGYYRDYAEIINVGKERFDDLNVSTGRQKYFGKDGLYFCGFWISPTGQIREIALDAKKIAKDIFKKEKLFKSNKM